MSEFTLSFWEITLLVALGVVAIVMWVIVSKYYAMKRKLDRLWNENLGYNLLFSDIFSQGSKRTVSQVLNSIQRVKQSYRLFRKQENLFSKLEIKGHDEKRRRIEKEEFI